jgi:phospholipase/carboxylesterase
MAVDVPLDTAWFGAPVASARLVVILVHGRDQSPEFMSDHVADRLGFDDVCFVAPAAPDGRWYPGTLDAPPTDNQPQLDRSLGVLGALEQRILDTGIPADRIVLCGFSQGASLVCTYAALSPRRRRAIVAFTGGLIGPPDQVPDVNGRLDGVPVYLSVSDADPWLTLERAKVTARAFRSVGAEVVLDEFTDRGHEVSDAEIERVQALLR